jgi:hypothetical protein
MCLILLLLRVLQELLARQTGMTHHCRALQTLLLLVERMGIAKKAQMMQLSWQSALQHLLPLPAAAVRSTGPMARLT